MMPARHLAKYSLFTLCPSTGRRDLRALANVLLDFAHYDECRASQTISVS